MAVTTRLADFKEIPGYSKAWRELPLTHPLFWNFLARHRLEQGVMTNGFVAIAVASRETLRVKLHSHVNWHSITSIPRFVGEQVEKVVVRGV